MRSNPGTFHAPSWNLIEAFKVDEVQDREYSDSHTDSNKRIHRVIPTMVPILGLYRDTVALASAFGLIVRRVQQYIVRLQQ